MSGQGTVQAPSPLLPCLRCTTQLRFPSLPFPSVARGAGADLRLIKSPVAASAAVPIPKGLRDFSIGFCDGRPCAGEHHAAEYSCSGSTTTGDSAGR